MTAFESRWARALSGCRLLPGSWDKRFIRSLAQREPDDAPLTPKQREHFARTLYRYRRQLGITDIDAAWVRQRILEGDDMTEADWLACKDPTRMLAFLTGAGQGNVWVETGRRPVSERKLRLFACACCRQVWDGTDECPGNRAGPCCQTNLCPVCRGSGKVGGLTDPRSRRAVEVAEKYADGEVTHEERVAADRDAADAVTPYNDMSSPQWIAQASAGLTSASELAWEVVRRPLDWLTAAVQAALLRDMLGNPFRPPMTYEGRWIWTDAAGKVDPHGCNPVPWVQRSWLAWNDGTVPKLAAAIYAGRAFDRMPLLADALEEAGCEDADILAHCRGKQRCGGCVERPGFQRLYPREQLSGSGPVYGTCWKCDGRIDWYAGKSDWKCGDPAAKGSGWVGASPHVRGCWVVDLLLGKG